MTTNVYPKCRTCGVIVDDIVDMGVTMAEANRKWEVTQFLVHEIQFWSQSVPVHSGWAETVSKRADLLTETMSS